jgi:V-type H+-transporting ATPase S1 subunit
VQRVISTNPNFLIALSSMKVDDTVVDIEQIVLSLNESKVATTLEVHLKVGETHNLGMMVEISGGTWWIPYFYYNGQRLMPNGQVSAYDSKSYGCIDLRLSNGKQVVVLEDIQIQPRFDDAKPEVKMFSDNWNDCVGFFSPAIWGALFVVIILVSILTCGLTMMMDIKTMDRFDDPKGKTITINAQE